MRRRSTIGWLLAATLAGALAGVVLGIAGTRYQVRLLRAEVARLEQSRAQLQENSEQLAEALREARAPLAWRIRELETTLASRESTPDSEEPEQTPAIADTAERAPSEEPIQVAAAVPPAPEPVAPKPAPPKRAESPATRAPAALEEEPAVAKATPLLETPSSKASAPPPAKAEPAPAHREPESPSPPPRAAPSPAPRSAPAPPPAVSAAPPDALPSSPSDPDDPCRSLAAPGFALDFPGEEVRRFEGRLVLSVDAAGPALVMHLGDDTSHSLAELPLHVATLCEGLAYIVSVCVAERDPFEVRGVISSADTWNKPCRELLRARARANP